MQSVRALARARWLHALGALLLLGVLAASTRAAAADTNGATSVPRLVVIDSRLSGVLEFELEEALAELLGRLQLRIVGPGTANTGNVLAVVSIESLDGGALVTVQEAHAPHSRVRRDVERSESAGLFRETLAHVILGAVEPMLRTAQAAAAAREVREAPAVAPDEPDAASSPGWAAQLFSKARGSLGVRASALWFAADRAVAPLLGAAIGASFDAAMRPSLALEVSYLFPVSVEHSGAAADFSLVALRARPGFELARSGATALVLDAALGVDFVRLRPTSSDPATSFIVERSTRAQPILGASANARFALSRELELIARAGIDVDLSPRRWLISDGVTASEFFESARVLPYTTLGVDWSPVSTKGPTAEAAP